MALKDSTVPAVDALGLARVPAALEAGWATVWAMATVLEVATAIKASLAQVQAAMVLARDLATELATKDLLAQALAMAMGLATAASAVWDRRAPVATELVPVAAVGVLVQAAAWT
jgi:hypothetical protein